MNIGKIEHNINVSMEYYRLAEKDKDVALLLRRNFEYRHSIYYFVQAMEKYIRSKIFTLVNPNISYFRDRNRSHSLDDAINFLIEIISTDTNIQEQIKLQLNEHVLKNINFQHLHNNLRYPYYSVKYDSYSRVDYTKLDCDLIEESLNSLKLYLNDLNRL